MFLKAPTFWVATLRNTLDVIDVRVDGSNGKFIEMALDEAGAEALRGQLGNALDRMKRARSGS